MSTQAPPRVLPANAATATVPWWRRDLSMVLGAGAVVELALLAGWLWPLRIWQPSWAITDPEPLSRMVGRSTAGLGLFLTTLLLWLGSYVVVLTLSRRRLPASARSAILLLPLLFAITLAPTWPAASKDVYHYVIEGRTLAVHGLNPLTTAPASLLDDPLYWILSSWQWEPSRYGPLWALIAAVPARLAGSSLTAAVLGFKTIGVAAFAGVAFLVYLTARWVCPERALPAYALVAWNPLLLVEAAANAHNDILMLACTALALWCAARRDWTFAFPALAAGILVKYTCGLLGPLLLLWAWRESAGHPAQRRQLVLGLALALWLTLSAYALLWSGAETVRALGGAAADALNSPGWLLREALQRTLLSERAAGLVVGAPLAVIFLAVNAVALRRVWLGRRGTVALWQAGLLAMTVYLATVSWWFWPWYVTWLLPLAGLLVGRRHSWLVVVWSAGALLAYVPITFRPFFWGEPSDDRMPLAVCLTIFVPVAAAALLLWWRRREGSGSASPR